MKFDLFFFLKIKDLFRRYRNGGFLMFSKGIERDQWNEKG